MNRCFLRRGREEEGEVRVVRIKYSHALAAVVTHSSIRLSGSLPFRSQIIGPNKQNKHAVCTVDTLSLTLARSAQNTLWNRID